MLIFERDKTACMPPAAARKSSRPFLRFTAGARAVMAAQNLSRLATGRKLNPVPAMRNPVAVPRRVCMYYFAKTSHIANL